MCALLDVFSAVFLSFGVPQYSNRLHATKACDQRFTLTTKKSLHITFKGYSCYHSYATEVNDVAHGGSAILVNSSTPHRQLNLQTCLQAVAIRVICHKTISVLPSMVFNTSDFYDLLQQLPPPCAM